MKKFEKEYIINVSPSVLYPRLTTPSGLSDWFADDVNIKNGVYTFYWDGSEQSAKMLSKKLNQYIRFKWEDIDDEEAYFELRLTADELTGEVALLVEDFADEDEVEDSIELWDTQIDKLRHMLGA